MLQLHKRAGALITGLSLATFAPLAMATTPTVDVSSVVSAIEAAATPIAAIGAAVLIVMVGIKVYKWVRRAM